MYAGNRAAEFAVARKLIRHARSDGEDAHEHLVVPGPRHRAALEPEVGPDIVKDHGAHGIGHCLFLPTESREYSRQVQAPATSATWRWSVPQQPPSTLTCVR